MKYKLFHVFLLAVTLFIPFHIGNYFIYTATFFIAFLFLLNFINYVRSLKTVTDANLFYMGSLILVFISFIIYFILIFAESLIYESFLLDNLVVNLHYYFLFALLFGLISLIYVYYIDNLNVNSKDNSEFNNLQVCLIFGILILVLITENYQNGTINPLVAFLSPLIGPFSLIFYKSNSRNFVIRLILLLSLLFVFIQGRRYIISYGALFLLITWVKKEGDLKRKFKILAYLLVFISGVYFFNLLRYDTDDYLVNNTNNLITRPMGILFTLDSLSGIQHPISFSIIQAHFMKLVPSFFLGVEKIESESLYHTTINEDIDLSVSIITDAVASGGNYGILIFCLMLFGLHLVFTLLLKLTKSRTAITLYHYTFVLFIFGFHELELINYLLSLRSLLVIFFISFVLSQTTRIKPA